MILCFNKEDIASSEEKLSELAEIYEKCGCQLVFISAKEEKNMTKLCAELLEGKTYSNCWDLPVWESRQLINCLNPNAVWKPAVSVRKIERGKHTTRHSELFMIGEDSYIMDTPGFSSLICE